MFRSFVKIRDLRCYATGGQNWQYYSNISANLCKTIAEITKEDIQNVLTVATHGSPHTLSYFVRFV